MRKQLRKLQPAHRGGSITVAQAARAFRLALGDTPRVEAYDAAELEEIRASGRRIVKHEQSRPIAADNATKGNSRKK